MIQRGHALLYFLFVAFFVHDSHSTSAYSTAVRSTLFRNRKWMSDKGHKKAAGRSTEHTIMSTEEGFTNETILRVGGQEIDGSGQFAQLKTKKFARELLAEFIGTGIIVFLGTGAVMSAVISDSLVGLFQIAAVWIIAVTLAIATTGPISGAHLNPSISIAFALLRPCAQFGWIKVIPYIVAQTLGATFFSWLNLMMYAPAIRVFEEVNNIVRGTPESIASAKCFGEYYLEPIGTLTAFYAEALGTAALAFVIFALTHHRNEDVASKNVYIPPLIGMTVGGLISIIAPLTQAGFNPARDFGPRIVAWLAGWQAVSWQGWWVYVVAPIIGAPIGAFVADYLLYGNDPIDPTATTLQ